MNLRTIYEAIASYDQSSWISHWLLTIVSSVLIYVLLDHESARIWAEALFGLFCFKEGYEWATHKALNDKPRYKRDGILDLAGPTLNLIFWIFV